MNKCVVLSLAAVFLLSGCGTYAGTGAYTGATLGSVIGSAVGGITGGPRGSDIGTLVGMAGGAALGGAVGAQTDKNVAEQRRESDRRFSEKYRKHREAATRGNDDYYPSGGYGYDDESGFDPEGRGDDVLYDFQSSEYTGDYTAASAQPVVPGVRYDGLPSHSVRPELPLEVRNARFVDGNQDRKISSGETCKVIFEVYNRSSEPVYDVQPMVVETTGNKRISISGTVHVECVRPGKGVRYTAVVKADKRLKDGSVSFRVYAVDGNGRMASAASEFNVPTEKRRAR